MNLFVVGRYIEYIRMISPDNSKMIKSYIYRKIVFAKDSQRT